MSGTQKNVSYFVQKHFVSATNVSQFAQPKKHHEQQCVRNNVSSFASTCTIRLKGSAASEPGVKVGTHLGAVEGTCWTSPLVCTRIL